MVNNNFDAVIKVLGETPTLHDIAKYVFDNFNDNDEFLACLNDDSLPFPAEVQFILDEYDVVVDELMETMSLYIAEF